jgi:hypothetical protein
MSDDIKINVGIRSAVKAGMEQVGRDVKAGSSKIESGGMFKNLASSIGFAAVAIGIRSLIKEIGDLQDTAEQVNFSTENYQKLKIAAENSGSGIEKMEVSLGKLAKAQADIGTDKNAQKAFEALGISVESVIKSNPEQLFEMVAEGFAKTGNKSALFDLFGKSASKLIPTLRELAGGFKDFNADGIISNEAIERADKLDKKMNAITRTLKSWAAVAIDKTVGGIEAVAGALGAWSAGGSVTENDKSTAKAEAAKKAKEDAAKKEIEDLEASRKLREYGIQQEIDGVKEIEKARDEEQEAEKVQARQDAQQKTGWEEKSKAGQGKRTALERIMGRPDLNLAQQADRETKLALDDDFRRSEKDKDREFKRAEDRTKALSKRAENMFKSGMKLSPQLQRIWDADIKQAEAANVQKNLDEIQKRANEATIKAQLDAAETAKNTLKIKELQEQIFKG